MKAMLYLHNKTQPVAVLDDVTLITMDDNHKAASGAHRIQKPQAECRQDHGRTASR